MQRTYKQQAQAIKEEMRLIELTCFQLGMNHSKNERWICLNDAYASIIYLKTEEYIKSKNHEPTA